MILGKWKGHAAMVGANVIWGLMAPVAKAVLGAAVIGSLSLTGFRIFGAALLFWAASAFMPRQHVPPRDLLLLAGASVLGIITNQGCFIFGVGLTSPAEASLITTTMPMWVMVLAAVILKEPITLKKAGGIALGATGAIVLVLNNAGASTAHGANPAIGDLLVLTAQISYALYLTFYKNFIKKYSVVTLMKWMFTFASVLIAVPVATELVRTDFSNAGTTTWLGVGYVVVFGTFVAYLFMMTGQKLLRPTVVGMYNYVQPIVATTVAVALGMDEFNALKICAVALIFSGVYLVVISKSRFQAESEATNVAKHT